MSSESLGRIAKKIGNEITRDKTSVGPGVCCLLMGFWKGFFPCERYLGKQCEQQQQEKKGPDQKIGQSVFTIRF